MAQDDLQSRYVIFADESGDHGLNSKSHSRAFVIAFAIFRRDVYEQSVVPAFQDYKRLFFQDQLAPLHEREIRRGEGVFRRLRGDSERQEAREALLQLLRRVPFAIVEVGIDKDRFSANPERVESPYLRRFIETLVACLMTMPDMNAADPPTEIVADSRGAKEDQQLQSLVDSLTDSEDPDTGSFRFRIRFTTKADVEVGVEVADLIANPISRRVLRQEHPMIPFHLLEPKFLRHPDDPSRLSLIVLEHE